MTNEMQELSRVKSRMSQKQVKKQERMENEKHELSRVKSRKVEKQVQKQKQKKKGKIALGTLAMGVTTLLSTQLLKDSQAASEQKPTYATHETKKEVESAVAVGKEGTPKAVETSYEEPVKAETSLPTPTPMNTTTEPKQEVTAPPVEKGNVQKVSEQPKVTLQTKPVEQPKQQVEKKVEVKQEQPKETPVSEQKVEKTEVQKPKAVEPQKSIAVKEEPKQDKKQTQPTVNKQEVQNKPAEQPKKEEQHKVVKEEAKTNSVTKKQEEVKQEETKVTPQKEEQKQTVAEDGKKEENKKTEQKPVVSNDRVEQKKTEESSVTSKQNVVQDQKKQEEKPKEVQVPKQEQQVQENKPVKKEEETGPSYYRSLKVTYSNGIFYVNGITLGSNRDFVRAKLGKPEAIKMSGYYGENLMAEHYTNITVIYDGNKVRCIMMSDKEGVLQKFGGVPLYEENEGFFFDKSLGKGQIFQVTKDNKGILNIFSDVFDER